MTVTVQVPRVKVAGNGSTFAFNFPFLIPSDTNGGSSYCTVMLLDTTVTPNTLATLSSNQFSVSGLDNPSGGSVTYPLSGAAIPTGQYIIILRNVPYDQPTAFPNQGFYPESVETSEDWLAQQIQQIVYQLDQTFQVPASDPPPAQVPAVAIRANKVAGFDGSGNLINGLATLAQVDAAAGAVPTGSISGTFPTTSTLLGYFPAPASLVNGVAFLTAARSSPGDRGGGVFYYNAGDTTTADNGGSIRVDLAGRRWYLANLTLVTPELFGAVGDGVTDDVTEFNSATAALAALSTGGVLVCAARKYAISDQINITSNNIKIIGMGPNATQFIPLSNNKDCIVLFASFCAIRDLGFLNVGGVKTGVRGIVLGATVPTQTSTLVITNNNSIENIQYLGLAVGRVMAPGPHVGGSDSECYFNNFTNEAFKSCVVSIEFLVCTTNTAGGANGNITVNIDIEDELGLANAGIIIYQGSSNKFYGGYIEGVLNGSSPLGTATAIQIQLNGGGISNNTANKFDGITIEACSRGIDNSGLQTALIDVETGTVPNLLGTLPGIWLNSNPSAMPIILPGYLYQTGGEVAAYNEGGTLGFGTTQWFNAGPGGPRFVPKVGATGPGGGAVAFSFSNGYVANAVFEVVAGANDQAGTQVSGNFKGTFCEGPSGTFTQLDPTTGYSTTAGTPASFSVAITRSGGNIVVTVTITKAAITFTAYAHLVAWFQNP